MRASQRRWRHYRDALEGQPLPAGLVDLDAFEANVDAVVLLARGKSIRIATKSIRSPDLIERVLARGGSAFRGLMTYSAAETAFWAERGQRDLLLAYPTLQRSDLDHLVHAQRLGATAAVVVDCEAHVSALAAVAREADVVLPAVIEVDVSYRPAGSVHVGVRRSPLRSTVEIVALAERIASDAALSFHGVMAYEAQIAGLGDQGIGWRGAPIRLLKRRSARDVATTRAEIARALGARDLLPPLFNGGGSGSLRSSVREDALSEVTVGSAFLASHLFDHYAEVRFAPAAFFALQVVRRPGPGLLTCQGGGFIASGAAGSDRLPRPALPDGLELLPLEGAGEVQTPLRVPDDVTLGLGDPVFFRHAKAGELAEHLTAYHLVRGARVEARAATYRGMGLCWLG